MPPRQPCAASIHSGDQHNDEGAMSQATQEVHVRDGDARRDLEAVRGKFSCV